MKLQLYTAHRPRDDAAIDCYDPRRGAAWPDVNTIHSRCDERRRPLSEAAAGLAALGAIPY